MPLESIVFIFFTASAAKEAMLPYFPQIVEFIKVKCFFTVYNYFIIVIIVRFKKWDPRLQMSVSTI